MKQIASMEMMRNAYKILAGEPEGVRTLGRCRLRGKIIIKQRLKKYCFRLWIRLKWHSMGTGWCVLVNMAVNFRVP
jgi:hypothetical protein